VIRGALLLALLALAACAPTPPPPPVDVALGNGPLPWQCCRFEADGTTCQSYRANGCPVRR
jgi:hypothetical protein